MKHSLKYLERLIAEDRAKGTDDSSGDVGHWLGYARKHRFGSSWAWWLWITGPVGMWPWEAWACLRRARAMEARIEANKLKLARYLAEIGENFSAEQQAEFRRHLGVNSNHMPESKS
jgi:hypothetical protein